MDWLKKYGPATFGMLTAAWIAGYAGFNMGASARLESDQVTITGSIAKPTAKARPHSNWQVRTDIAGSISKPMTYTSPHADWQIEEPEIVLSAR